MSDNNSGMDIMEQDLYDGKPEKDQQSGEVRKHLPPRDQYGAALSRDPAVRLHTTQAQQIQKTAPVYPSSSSSTHNYFDNKCKKCDHDVLDTHQAIQCDGCERWHHLGCITGVTEEQYLLAVSNTGEVDWKCAKCTVVNSIVTNKATLGEDHQEHAQGKELESIGDMPKKKKTVEEGGTCKKRKLCATDSNETVKRQKEDIHFWEGLKKHAHPAKPITKVVKLEKNLETNAQEFEYLDLDENRLLPISQVVRESIDIVESNSRPRTPAREVCIDCTILQENVQSNAQQIYGLHSQLLCAQNNNQILQQQIDDLKFRLQLLWNKNQMTGSSVSQNMMYQQPIGQPLMELHPGCANNQQNTSFMTINPNINMSNNNQQTSANNQQVSPETTDELTCASLEQQTSSYKQTSQYDTLANDVNIPDGTTTLDFANASFDKLQSWILAEFCEI